MRLRWYIAVAVLGAVASVGVAQSSPGVQGVGNQAGAGTSGSNSSNGGASNINGVPPARKHHRRHHHGSKSKDKAGTPYPSGGASTTPQN